MGDRVSDPRIDLMRIEDSVFLQIADPDPVPDPWF